MSRPGYTTSARERFRIHWRAVRELARGQGADPLQAAVAAGWRPARAWIPLRLEKALNAATGQLYVCRRREGWQPMYVPAGRLP